MTEPILDEYDIQTNVWRKIVAHFEERLKAHDRKNRGTKPEQETAKLRGRIAEAEYILALGKPKPNTEFEDRE